MGTAAVRRYRFRYRFRCRERPLCGGNVNPSGLPGQSDGPASDDSARRRGDCHTNVPRDARRDQPGRRSRIGSALGRHQDYGRA
jgi:hypothetical protein